MDQAKPDATIAREQRLAAQLRANLRRRKQQARALGQPPAQDGDDPAAETDHAPPVLAKPPLAKPRDDG